ncbi:PRC-barrel domain-containing protein [Streptomyces sp. NPDC001941]|uniref:PRC-barrel domain-containing protein n=1 Tax=Streptomyces sp. NPDC001941 TaxID=3154659 RepID=UPI00332FB8FA
MAENIWSFPNTAGHTPDIDLTGYRVEATDGAIGKVDKHTDEAGPQYIVVDTGVWIFGKEVLLPAGTIMSINMTAKTIQVARTKDEIKNAPEFQRDRHLTDHGYFEQVGMYYGAAPGAWPLGPGPHGLTG